MSDDTDKPAMRDESTPPPDDHGDSAAGGLIAVALAFGGALVLATGGDWRLSVGLGIAALVAFVVWLVRAGRKP